MHRARSVNPKIFFAFKTWAKQIIGGYSPCCDTLRSGSSKILVLSMIHGNEATKVLLSVSVPTYFCSYSSLRFPRICKNGFDYKTQESISETRKCLVTSLVYLQGVCFDEQIVESVPTSSTDVPLDFVFTPSHVFRRDTDTGGCWPAGGKLCSSRRTYLVSHEVPWFAVARRNGDSLTFYKK